MKLSQVCKIKNFTEPLARLQQLPPARMEIHWLVNHGRPSTSSTALYFHRLPNVSWWCENRWEQPKKASICYRKWWADWLYGCFFKFELISSAPFSCSIISDARNNIFFQDRQNSLANLKNNQCHKKNFNKLQTKLAYSNRTLVFVQTSLQSVRIATTLGQYS